MRTKHWANWLLPAAMFTGALVVAGGCPAPQGPDPVPPPAEQPAPPEPVSADPSEELPVGPAPSREPPVVDTEEAPPTESEESEPAAVDPAPADDPGSEPVSEEAADSLPARGPYGGKGADSEIDFVALNGPIFENWPKPDAALLFSGMQRGFIEPCGCAGKENMKGGISRRHTLIEQLRGRGWPLASLELGGLVRRFGTQAELKYHATHDALHRMDYAAVGFGIDDLRLPTEALISTLKPGEPSHFVSANVGLYGFDSGLTHPYRVVEAGGLRFAVTGVLGERQRGELRNDEIETRPAAEALAELLPSLRESGADRLVLLVNGEPDEATELARLFPAFDVVAVSGPADPPPARAEAVEGAPTRLIELGQKGMYVGVLAFFADEAEPVRYQRVPLDGRFEDSPEMHRVMVHYQDQLKALGWEGLGIRPIPEPSGREFIGSQSCAICHTQAHAHWTDTPHAKAWETLARLDPPRTHDAECVSCHVVGWEPQRYVPFEGGFVSEEKTPELTAQGCENCHGGGREHALIEMGRLNADDARREMARAAMRMSLDTEAGRTAARNNCMACHDLDNSPNFNFDTYWPRVEHKGLR